MTDDGSAGRPQERWGGLEQRIDEGEFDAALRPDTTGQALRDGPRQFFALAAEAARTEFDPADRWDDFEQALWEQVDGDDSPRPASTSRRSSSLPPPQGLAPAALPSGDVELVCEQFADLGQLRRTDGVVRVAG